MAFRTNSYQQLSFADSFEGLTFREQKALEHSWAKVFAEDIFPAINEEPFRVLYSSNASRPNTPVNVCIGALIIKELFGISDDEVVENLMLDPRYQYALHTSSFEEQPLSDKTLTRFRKRCYDYESIHGIDLLHEADRTWNEYRKTYGHQPKGQKNGFHDDSSKYTETQPYRAALYLRKKAGHLFPQKQPR